MKRPAEVLLSRLEGVRGKSPKWMARCPAHSDNGPSLSIRQLDDGRVLVHCFAGCGATDVMAAVGMTLADLYPDAPYGELTPKPHRQGENILSRSGFYRMQDEIYRLRAKMR